MNKDQILGIVRHLLTFGGGFLAAKGWANDAELTTGISGLIAFIGFVWSVVAKAKAPKLPTALLAFILLPSTFILLTGCGTVKPHGNVDVVYNADGTVTAGTGLDIGTNATVNATGGYNVATGAWTAGISIVFKSEADAAAAAAELALHNLGPAPVVRSNATAWRIDAFDPRSRYHSHVIEAALKHGATLQGI